MVKSTAYMSKRTRFKVFQQSLRVSRSEFTAARPTHLRFYNCEEGLCLAYES